MKILIPSPQQRKSGVAVVVVLALLSIMLLYVAANVRSLHHLGRELKLLERQQVHRLNLRATATNPLSGTNASTSAGQTPPR